ncbi:hypothetical protein EES44_30515 [Streptomyces sp. ADI96-15]|nr:hypothetical protein EES44_30515 [Streptomyces sp. ADI96-15]
MHGRDVEHGGFSGAGPAGHAPVRRLRRGLHVVVNHGTAVDHGPEVDAVGVRRRPPRHPLRQHRHGRGRRLTGPQGPAAVHPGPVPLHRPPPRQPLRHGALHGGPRLGAARPLGGQPQHQLRAGRGRVGRQAQPRPGLGVLGQPERGAQHRPQGGAVHEGQRGGAAGAGRREDSGEDGGAARRRTRPAGRRGRGGEGDDGQEDGGASGGASGVRPAPPPVPPPGPGRARRAPDGGRQEDAAPPPRGGAHRPAPPDLPAPEEAPGGGHRGFRPPVESVGVARGRHQDHHQEHGPGRAPHPHPLHHRAQHRPDQLHRDLPHGPGRAVRSGGARSNCRAGGGGTARTRADGGGRHPCKECRRRVDVVSGGSVDARAPIHVNPQLV